MNASSRFLALVAIGGTMALAACGGSDLSPVASTTVLTGDSGSVTSSGNGPGAPPVPAPSPGTGTCTNDCDGTGQGPGPGSGYGPGNGAGYGPANGNGPGNGYGPGPGPSDGFCGNACTGAVGPDPRDIATLLVDALQEEYKAQMLYRSVLQTFGAETVPFALIEQAEARHVEALQMLFARRQMTPPASAWAPGELPAVRFGAPRLRGGRRGRAGGRGLLHAVPAARRPAPGRPQRLHEPAEGLAREPPPGFRELPVGAPRPGTPPPASTARGGVPPPARLAHASPARDGLSSRS